MCWRSLLRLDNMPRTSALGDAADLRLAGDPRNVPGPDWPAQTQEDIASPLYSV